MKFPILDLETTGLEHKTGQGTILEISVVIADTEFNVHEEYTAVLPIDTMIFGYMNDWARKTHTESGLVKECMDATKSIGEVENEVLALLDRHFGKEAILTGNSIHFDRRFLREHMSRLDQRLHYRMLDVSALWEWLRMFKGVSRPDLGPVAHRGIPDTRGSLKLLQLFGEKVSVRDDSQR